MSVYELSDHLGNVTTTVSDLREGTLANHDLAAKLLSYNQYYPFGWTMPGRSFQSSNEYRYGFNGQEQDPDLFNGGVVFKYRTEDPRVARFFSVDPIASQYPELTPYQVASLSPIYMVELEGLEGFPIHGTGQSRSDKIYADNLLEEFKRVGEFSVLDESFSWGKRSWLGNRRYRERAKSSFDLANHVVETRNKLLSEGVISESEPIVLIGYSHGGNVGIQAAEEIYERTGVEVTIITVATPAYNNRVIEDPATQSGIDRHIHIWSAGDGVDAYAQGNETYNNGYTINYEVPEEYIPHTGYKDTHYTMGDEERNSRLGDFVRDHIGKKSDLPKFKETKEQYQAGEDAKDRRRESYNSNK